MNIFHYKHYKELLSDYIKNNNHRGLITQLAQICGCDRTYISQVLNGKADLLPDHIVKMCEHWDLDEKESEYFLYLLLKDRATTLASQKIFETKLKKLRDDALELTQKIQNKKDFDEVEEKYKTLYYSNWLYPLVHTLTSIDDFQSVESLAKKTGVVEGQIILILKTLQEMNLVIKKNNKYIHSGRNIYLTRDSAQIYSLHLQARLESVRRSYEKKDVHFTNIFAVSENDVDLLRDQILNLIEQHRNSVHASGSEVVGVFVCDFFIA